MSSEPSQIPRVEGELLVVPDKTALPERCIRTNVSLDARKCQVERIPHYSHGFKLFLFVAPNLLVLAPLLARRHCFLKAGIAARVRRRLLLRKLIFGAMIAISLPLPFVLLALPEPRYAGLGWLCFPIGFYGGFLGLAFYSRPLKIVKYKHGMYWLSGCSPEFLASLQASEASVPTS